MTGFIIFIILALIIRVIYVKQAETNNATRNIVDDIYQEVSPFEMYDKIFKNNPPLSELQRDALWQQFYANNKIKWTCRIAKISKSWNDDILVEGYAEYFKTKDGDNDKFFKLSFTIGLHEKDRLLKLNLGDKIQVSASLPKECPYYHSYDLNLDNASIS